MALWVELKLEVDGSARYEFLAFWGILPETYREAPPRPGFSAGSLLATTVVDRGMENVSSSYSITLSDNDSSEFLKSGPTKIELTFTGIFRANNQFKVCTVS